MSSLRSSLRIFAVGLLLSLAPARAEAERLMSIYDAGTKTSVSLFIGVPLFLDVDYAVVRPGAALDGRFGVDFGNVSIETELGFQANPIDASDIADAPFDREPLNRVYAGLGIRFQVPNDTRLLPYLSATFDLAFWQLYETEIVIGNGYIYGRKKFDFAPGLGARAGFAVRVTNDLYVDLAVRFGMSFTGGFFETERFWLTPYTGLTYRR